MMLYIFCRGCSWERNATESPKKELPLKCPKCGKYKYLTATVFREHGWKKAGKKVREKGIIAYLTETLGPDQDAWFSSAGKDKPLKHKPKAKNRGIK